MPSDPIIRQMTRDKLMAVLKTPEMVKLFEAVLYGVGTTLPAGTDAAAALAAEALADAEAALSLITTHIGDPTGAHAASAISLVPSGGIAAIEVQGAIDELEAEKQAISPLLTAIAALATAADKLLYFTGPDAPATADFTAFARLLVAAVDPAAARSVLDLGSMATQNAPSVNITGGSVALASGILGYATGNGGTVAQAGTKSSGVTLDKICGEITMDNAALAANTAVAFTLTNSTIVAADRIIVNHAGAGTFGAYNIDARSAAGSASVVVRNVTGGSLSEAIVIGFAVVKSATS